MEKQQVHIEVHRQGDALLPFHEGEAGAQFQQERLQLAQDGGFEVALAEGVFQAEKIEEIRIAENKVGRKAALVRGLEFAR